MAVDPIDLSPIALQALSACGTPEQCDDVATYRRDLADCVAKYAERTRELLATIPRPDVVVPAAEPAPNS